MDSYHGHMLLLVGAKLGPKITQMTDVYRAEGVLFFYRQREGRTSMPAVRERAGEAYRRTVETEIESIARFLEEALGRNLVAYICGVSDSKAVGRWAKGERSPRRDAEERLRAAYQIFQLLQEEESPHTVRAWFIGLNPQLDDESPAAVLREGRLRDVVVAARSYIAGG